VPITHFACPPGKPTFGEAHEPEHCITACEQKCMSPFLMAAIVSSNQKNHHRGRYLSATSLSGCVRKLALERTVDYAEYYSNLYYSFRGTITHTVVENAATVDLGGGKSLEDLGFVSEWRMQVGFCFEHNGFELPPNVDPSDLATWAQVSCPGCDAAGIAPRDQTWIILGGTLDGAEPLWQRFDEATGVLYCNLHDVKTMQEYAVGYMIKGDPDNTLHPQVKDAYVKQANVYKYLAERSVPPEALRKRGVKRIKFVTSHIQAFAMGQAPWTGAGTYRWKDHWKNPMKDWPMYPIEFHPDEWVEQYIRENGRKHYAALITGQSRGEVTEPDPSKNGTHSWMCDFCPFYASEMCPNPAAEWKMANVEGMDPEAAFAYASKHPAELPEDRVEPLNKKDTANVAKFWRRQRGEPDEPEAPEETDAKKPKKKRVTKKNKEAA
jgi:hypothetical protein